MTILRQKPFCKHLMILSHSHAMLLAITGVWINLGLCFFIGKSLSGFSFFTNDAFELLENH